MATSLPPLSGSSSPQFSPVPSPQFSPATMFKSLQLMSPDNSAERKRNSEERGRTILGGRVNHLAVRTLLFGEESESPSSSRSPSPILRGFSIASNSSMPPPSESSIPSTSTSTQSRGINHLPPLGLLKHSPNKRQRELDFDEDDPGRDSPVSKRQEIPQIINGNAFFDPHKELEDWRTSTDSEEEGEGLFTFDSASGTSTEDSTPYCSPMKNVKGYNAPHIYGGSGRRTAGGHAASQNTTRNEEPLLENPITGVSINCIEIKNTGKKNIKTAFPAYLGSLSEEEFFSQLDEKGKVFIKGKNGQEICYFSKSEEEGFYFVRTKGRNFAGYYTAFPVFHFEKINEESETIEVVYQEAAAEEIKSFSISIEQLLLAVRLKKQAFEKDTYMYTENREFFVVDVTKAFQNFIPKEVRQTYTQGLLVAIPQRML